jgi:hypothetical protein
MARAVTAESRGPLVSGFVAAPRRRVAAANPLSVRRTCTVCAACVEDPISRLAELTRPVLGGATPTAWLKSIMFAAYGCLRTALHHKFAKGVGSGGHARAEDHQSSRAFAPNIGSQKSAG